jgi:excisionase family DNA binding protein
MGFKKTASSEPLLLRPTDAARLLSISRSKVYELISSGELPGVVRIGRSVRIALKALLGWIDACSESKGAAGRGSTSSHLAKDHAFDSRELERRASGEKDDLPTAPAEECS